MVCQICRFFRSTVASEVFGCGDDQHAAGADLAGNVAGLQPAGYADRQVDALLDEVHAPVAEIHVERNFRIALREIEQDGRQPLHAVAEWQADANVATWRQAFFCNAGLGRLDEVEDDPAFFQVSRSA